MEVLWRKMELSDIFPGIFERILSSFLIKNQRKRWFMGSFSINNFFENTEILKIEKKGTQEYIQRKYIYNVTINVKHRRITSSTIQPSFYHQNK